MWFWDAVHVAGDARNSVVIGGACENLQPTQWLCRPRFGRVYRGNGRGAVRDRCVVRRLIALKFAVDRAECGIDPELLLSIQPALKVSPVAIVLAIEMIGWHTLDRIKVKKKYSAGLIPSV